MGDSINITNQLQGNVTGNVTGSITGLAGSVSSGGNIHIGVMTATSYYGDASNLTGIAATNFNTQTVTADSSETIIDLADGNCITMTQTANTTVGFASTSEAMDVTLIREPGGPYNISYSSGGVVFTGPGGTEDYLSIPDDADFDFATGDFTIEFWMYLSGNSSNNPVIIGADGGWYFQTKTGDTVLSFYTGVTEYTSTSTALSTGGWHHIAISRSGTSLKVFVDGETRISDTDSGNVNLANALNIGRYGAGSLPFTGRLSNLRIVKGTAVYTNNFVPPKAALTNISGTVLLCCQSDSSTTASTVTPGTITANNSPTAAAQTIALSGSSFPSTTITWPSNVKWNGRSAPTLISTASSTGERQQFQFVTGDTGLNWYAWETFKNDPLNLQAWTWGRSNDGQKGQNDTVQRSSPVQVPGNYQYVSYGPGSSTAIKSDGSLWGWGDGAAGILGQNNNISRSSPTQIGTDNNWKSLQWGNACCWGLKNDNTLWAWGSNPDGQFGSGNVTQRSSPIQISGIWSELQDGGTGSMGALKSDGSLWRWGANNNGELGDNSRVYRSSPIQLPGTWNSMSGGNGVMAAVNTDGELWSMGRNFAGVLGQNQSPSNTRYSSPTQIGTGTDWSTVHMVKYFGGALKTDGSLWVWGNNEYGQLGLRTRNTPDENGYSSPTQVPGAWSNLKSYNNGFVASKSDGSLWIWGGAFEGLLGLNQSYPDSSLGQSSPCQIPGTWNLDNTTNAEGGPLVLKEP
jgi:alpha-tubulin suppressor-like RCC1 family protein